MKTMSAILMGFSVFAVCLSSQASDMDVLKMYLTDDVVAIGYVDLDKVDFDSALKYAVQFGFDEEDELADAVEMAPLLKSQVDMLRQSGIGKIYAIIRTSDIGFFGTSWVMPVKGGRDPAKATEAVRRVLALCPNQWQSAFKYCEPGNSAVLASASSKQLTRLKNDRPSDPRTFAEAWSALGSGSVGVIIHGDNDSRRVIREMFPSLPAPFEMLTGDLVADHLDWGGFSFSLIPHLNAKVEIQASDEGSAAEVIQAMRNGSSMISGLPVVRSFLPETKRAFLLDALEPTQQGARISLTTAKLTEDMQQLAELIAPSIRLARQKSKESSRLQRLRNLSLAMHNYESAYGNFPPAASVDEAGKPLLSWRVHVLPFLGQMNLYKQFRLDEPWNSENNLPLVTKMPSFFADTNLNARSDNKQGRTVFQLPVGDGLLFNGPAETKFGGLKDGSSNTLMIVAVARKQASIWTKPDDWRVDFSRPIEGLQEDGRTSVEAAAFDGSTHRIPISVAAEVLKALLTPDGGEIVPWPN